MRCVGLDISRGKVAACLVENDPLGADYIDLFHSLEVHEIPADARGIQFLLSLEPDVIALEPTGMHYAKLWVNVASERGIPIYWIGHKQLARFREELGFEDKNDEQDAFAIACYWWRYRDRDRRFVRQRHPLAAKLRSLGLRLQHINRCCNPHANYLRQLLSWQFPEAARATLQRTDGRATALLNFIADGEGSKRWTKAYEKTCGAGIDDNARFAARQIRELGFEEVRVMSELLSVLTAPELKPYRKVLTAFRFGARSQAVIISQIYPLSDFLDENNRPIVKVTKGKKSGKPTAKHLSRRRFEKCIGCAPVERSSGIKFSKKSKGGSALCRQAMLRWVVRIARKKHPMKLSDPDAIALRDRLHSLKDSGVPALLAQGRVAGDAARKLFYRLVKELNDE